MAFKNIVVVGGSGNLGPAIVKELQAAGLNVTVTTRKDSISKFPEGVKVARTDYYPSSLVEIFNGQDAVICTFGGGQIDQQKAIIDACIQTGVKRYFPSEFGGDTRNREKVEGVSLFETKQEMTSYVKSKENALPWTAVVTGPFFDWGLNNGFLDFDLKNQKAAIWDGGNTKFSGTNLSTIGKAIAVILTKPGAAEATKNEYVAVASHTVSQNEILAAFEEVTGAKWETTPKKSNEEVQKAKESLAQGNQWAEYEIVKSLVFGQDALSDFNKITGGVWNEKLGLPKEDLKEDLKRALA